MVRTFWPIFRHFFATRWPKLGQHGPKANQFWTLTQQMHTLNLKLIEWLLFQIMIRNPRCPDTQMHRRSPFLCPLPTSSLGTSFWLCRRGQKWMLIHCGVVTPKGNINLNQHWHRLWLAAWQPITCTNVDFSSVKSRGIHLRATSNQMPKLLFCMNLKNYIFKITALSSRGQWVNELKNSKAW